MIFYHGSSIGRLTRLKPFISEHGKPYIYFSTNPLVALLYAVKPVPKPFSFYPYGFDNDGAVVFSEYYENAFFDIYNGKTGYLYSCHDLQDIQNPTQINCAYTCPNPVRPDDVSEIPDLYEYFKEHEGKGIFRIKSYYEISEKEMGFILSELEKDVITYKLNDNPKHPMSIFLKAHFQSVLEKNEKKQ